jgi:hypothetical protein
MNPLRKIGGLLLIAVSALAGNWIGTRLRASTTGEAEQSLSLLHTTLDGQTVLGLNIPLTNFVPALVLALLAGRPRTIYAFVSGAIISTLVGDGYERALASWIRQHVSARYTNTTAEHR